MAVSDRLPGPFDRAALPRQECVQGKRTLWGAYRQQRRDAKSRDIKFLLSFDDWLDVWETSGRLSERGIRRGQYVMARFNDTGPYAIANVEIITSGQNLSDGNTGKPRPKSAEHRRKLALAHLGKKLTEEHRKKIGDGVRGKLKGVPKSIEHRKALSKSRKQFFARLEQEGCDNITPEHRRKLSLAHRGKKLTEEHKKKIGDAVRRHAALVRRRYGNF